MRVKPALLVLAVFAGAVAAALAQSAEPLSYARDVEPIFAKECGDCHGADNPKKGLDLSASKGRAAMVGRPSKEVPEVLMVVAGDPDNSYLWHKLMHTSKEGKGMPRTIFGAKKLPQEQLDLIKRWIEEGAQP
ncbi:MAG: c-type cytochrome domain-containing protein [Acidobacteriota bacterium]